MRTISQTFRQTLLVGFLLLTGICLYAQVTVGDETVPNPFSILEISTANVKGGLRLPHLSNGERDVLSATTDFQAAKNRPGGAALGLTIYNTDTNCIEYWDGNKWVSLCLGTAEISFLDGSNLPVDPTQPPFPAVGGDKGPFTPVDIPNCTIENPPFAFVLVTGSEYTSIEIIDASTGKFTIRMEPNPMAKERNAILRVTNNCSGEYKEFIFTQNGDATDCGIAPSLALYPIQSYSGTEICRDGSLTLYLKDYPIGTFIWTLAGKEVGRGNFLTVTEPGRYTVYGDKIGCPNEASITLTKGSTPAPSTVDFIVIGNNGIACGVGGTVELIVNTISSGNIVWYKDGVKTTETGRKIDADKGQWFAVVEDGTCNSLPSKVVNVTENLDVATLAEPIMKVNDQLVGASLSLCRGGSMYLQVTNPDPNARYTWYINNNEVATGVNVYVPVPSASQFILRVRATGTGCATEALVEANITSGTAPNLPFIVVDTDDVLCGGRATLTATNSPTATSYRWFKDGVEYPGTTVSIIVTTAGSYTVSALVTGCSSIQSAPKVIEASDFATLSWGNHPTDANVGETRTYSVSLDFPQSASYNWAVSGSAVITNGQGTASITVSFPVAETVIVSCEAKNACGDALDSPQTQSVLVSPNCTNARITNESNLNPSIKVGNATTMSVTAAGTDLTYQWYSGSVGSGSAIGGATNAVYIYTASTTTGSPFQFYCVVTAGGMCSASPATSEQFNVTVTVDPETYPTGTGTFTGKTCFDIVFSNYDSNSCGSEDSRKGQKTIFGDRTKQDPATNNITPYSGVQVYTFNPTGTVSNVRFDYVDGTGEVIESVMPEGNYSGNSISSPCKVKVEFNESLDRDLRSRTRETAMKAELYVIYNSGPSNNGTDMKLRLSLNLQDCACCGARTVTGGWLTFMCYNLGADEFLDPFVYKSIGDAVDTDIKGSLYQWGRRTDGHEKRNSSSIPALASNNEATLPAPVIGKFITLSISGSPYDWRSGGGQDSRWGNGSAAENVPKADNDPCPAGWKVPSQLQWASIFSNSVSGNPSTATASPWIWTGNGYKVGDGLFLPAAGYRSFIGGSLNAIGSLGYYWSSTISGVNSYHLTFFNTNVNPTASFARAYGLSVRCVAE